MPDHQSMAIVDRMSDAASLQIAGYKADSEARPSFN
jgi:hypothetical protein